MSQAVDTAPTSATVTTGPAALPDRTIALCVAGALGICLALLGFMGIGSLWWPTQDWSIAAPAEHALETLAVSLVGGLLGMAQRPHS